MLVHQSRDQRFSIMTDRGGARRRDGDRDVTVTMTEGSSQESILTLAGEHFDVTEAATEGSS